jgi:hypothetical protein
MNWFRKLSTIMKLAVILAIGFPIVAIVHDIVAPAGKPSVDSIVLITEKCTDMVKSSFPNSEPDMDVHSDKSDSGHSRRLGFEAVSGGLHYRGYCFAEDTGSGLSFRIGDLKEVR